MGHLRALMTLALALLAPLPAHALSRGSPPYKHGIQWGQSAGGAYIRTIPTGSQIGIQNCAASYTDGFPPNTFIPSASGGCPPFGQDMNGILNALSLGLQWAFAGGTMAYDATFQTQIGGYPQGALVQSNILLGRVWRSTADNNLTNPDDQTGAAVSWTVAVGSVPAGTPVASFSSTTGPPGAVLANGLTVGDASSNATGRANADAYWLFSYLWNNCILATCNIFNSAGGASSKTTLAADWAAHKQMGMPDLRGAGMVGGDISTTRLSSAPTISGNATSGGSIIGEANNTHTLTAGELAAHTHPNTISVSDTGHAHTLNTIGNTAGGGGVSTFIPIAAQTLTTSTNSAAISSSITNNLNTPAGSAHNIVGRSMVIFWWLSL